MHARLLVALPMCGSSPERKQGDENVDREPTSIRGVTRRSPRLRSGLFALLAIVAASPLATAAPKAKNPAAPPTPVIDLSPETARQVVIAAGSEETYQGHPTTVLLPDGKTMY